MYKKKFNPFTGNFDIVFESNSIKFREGVDTAAHLPMVDNEEGDARITQDNGHLYVWGGSWQDEGDIIDLKWSSIENKPNSSIADIDDAVAKRHVALSYVDRGDPSAHDFNREDFIADSSWHPLDLSGIIPKGNILVHLRVKTKSILVAYAICFRKKGNINEYNIAMVVNKVAGVQNDEDKFVFCDSDRKIEYKLIGSNWEIVSILVKGWYI